MRGDSQMTHMSLFLSPNNFNDFIMPIERKIYKGSRSNKIQHWKTRYSRVYRCWRRNVMMTLGCWWPIEDVVDRFDASSIVTAMISNPCHRYDQRFEIQIKLLTIFVFTCFPDFYEHIKALSFLFGSSAIHQQYWLCNQTVVITWTLAHLFSDLYTQLSESTTCHIMSKGYIQCVIYRRYRLPDIELKMQPRPSSVVVISNRFNLKFSKNDVILN